MNSYKRKPLKAMTLIGSLLISGLIVSACGGGGGSSQSAGVGGTGVTTARGYVQGKVTGFGSIFVNGDKFNTDASNFIVDGNAGATQDDLAIGMIVTLEVETEDGVFTGKAFEVVYDDEVQGPVAGLPVFDPDETQRTFQVFGQTVTIDDTSTLFRGAPLNPDFGFETISNDDVVEISGFRTSPTTVNASYVEWKETLVSGISEVELRGTISGYAPPVKEFMLDGILITFDNVTDIELESGPLANGLFVEVEGIYNADLLVRPDPWVHAEEIEEEDEGFGDDIDNISLHGVITNYVGIASFKVNGQQVDASTAILIPANAAASLGNGVEVEVEGNIVGGVLIANELELREGESRLKAFVSAVFPGQPQFEVSYTGLPGSIEVITDSQTLFDDESPLELPNFSVADIELLDFVSVKGIESADTVTAEVVKRLDKADPDDSELRGQVDSFVTDTSITVLGITFGVNGATQYENSLEQPILPAIFFGILGGGDVSVEIEDKVTADGIAEEVKLND